MVLTPIILVVDDSLLIRSMVTSILESAQLSVVGVQSAEQAFLWLDRYTPDAILLDVVLPDLDGHEVCRRLKQRKRLTDVPILFLTSNHDEQSVLKAFEAGASDFITKPFSAAELKARISCHLSNKLINDELRVAYTKLQQAMEELRQQGLKDPLTNLFNRRYFIEMMSQWREESAAVPMYILLMDVDNFKQVNDTYGHCTGDYVLITVASLLMDQAGDHDVAGRWGGDEYLAILRGYSAAAVQEHIWRLVRSVSAYPFSYDDNSFHCSVTAGLAQLSPRHTIEENISAADTALYRAKAMGKNCVAFQDSREAD